MLHLSIKLAVVHQRSDPSSAGRTRREGSLFRHELWIPSRQTTRYNFRLIFKYHIWFELSGLFFCFSTEIASACVRHCQKLVQIHKKELVAATRDFTIDRLMNGVYYRHIHECSEMLEGIETLERLLKSGEKVIDLKP